MEPGRERARLSPFTHTDTHVPTFSPETSCTCPSHFHTSPVGVLVNGHCVSSVSQCLAASWIVSAAIATATCRCRVSEDGHHTFQKMSTHDGVAARSLAPFLLVRQGLCKGGSIARSRSPRAATRLASVATRGPSTFRTAGRNGTGGKKCTSREAARHRRRRIPISSVATLLRLQLLGIGRHVGDCTSQYALGKL